jgi:hypothetical protein
VFCDGGGVFSVPVEAGGGAFRAGTPRRLFDLGFQVDPAGSNFLISPDGKRFLLLSPPQKGTDYAEEGVTLVFGWLEELRRLVPTAAR